MEFKTLVSQCDEHNEISMLLVEKFKIKNLILICNDAYLKRKEDLKKVYKEIIPECNLRFEGVNIGDINRIKEIVAESDSLLINLAGGNRLNSLILLKVAAEKGVQSVYVDLANEKRYIFANNFKVINKKLQDVSIEEIFKLSGANIIEESSELCMKEEVVKITKIILNHLSLWHKYKQRLYDNEVFIHNYRESFKVVINEKNTSEEENELIDKSLRYLKKIDGIDYNKNQDEIEIRFKNNYLKGFLFKSGTWLEVVTYMIVNSIDEVDEVRSGVIFSWGNNVKQVRNELDVVAVKDSVLICISCKDSDKYDEDALNELQVYSEKLGGKEAIRILVATKEPVKTTLKDRANEMGISIIILDNDIENFKRKVIEKINRTP